MKIIARNPEYPIYPARGGYCHGLEISKFQRLLFTSGTMGLNADWEPLCSVEEQLKRAWQNLVTILGSANMSVDNVIRLTSYLTDREFSAPNAAARMAALNGREVPTTVVIVETLNPKWLIELEIIAAA